MGEMEELRGIRQAVDDLAGGIEITASVEVEADGNWTSSDRIAQSIGTTATTISFGFK